LILIAIAAISLNRVIGKNGKVPWDIPEDLHRFMRLTSGHTVLMGKKSFESLGKPLQNRRNVVLSSELITGVETYSTIDAALGRLSNEDKVFIIGGGEIFAQMLTRVDMIQLTIVERVVEGDTYFPQYEDLVKTQFTLDYEEQHQGFKYLDYSRKTSNTVAT
jgi:dihydrofolate reductase